MEQIQSPDTSDSEEEGRSRYWRWIPVENPRVESNLPERSATSRQQNKPELSETHLRRRIHVEPEQRERFNVGTEQRERIRIEPEQEREEFMDEGQGIHSEDENNAEQPQPNHDQDMTRRRMTRDQALNKKSL